MNNNKLESRNVKYFPYRDTIVYKIFCLQWRTYSALYYGGKFNTIVSKDFRAFYEHLLYEFLFFSSVILPTMEKVHHPRVDTVLLYLVISGPLCME